MDANNKHELKQGLSNRHIQLIALGGAIGTGLFLGLSQQLNWQVLQFYWDMQLQELLPF